MVLVLQEGFHQEWLDVWISHLQHLKIARWWAVVLSISRVIRARERDVVELRSVHAKKRVWCRKEKEWHEQGGHGWSRGRFFQNLWCTWAELLHHPAWKLRSMYYSCFREVFVEFLPKQPPSCGLKITFFVFGVWPPTKIWSKSRKLPWFLDDHDESHLLKSRCFWVCRMIFGWEIIQNFPAELDGLVDFVSSWESTCSHLRCDIIHPLDYLPRNLQRSDRYWMDP